MDHPALNPFDAGYYDSNDLFSFGIKKIGTNVKISKKATVLGLHNISIGDNVRIDDFTVISATSGYLELGSNIHIGSACYISCSGGVILRDYTGLSQSVKIYSSSDDYTGKSLTNPTVPSIFRNIVESKVTLEKHVIVGSNSVILPGVKIGIGCSIGAQSLVNKSLEEWGVYCGTPARFLKFRSKELLNQEALHCASIENKDHK